MRTGAILVEPEHLAGGVWGRSFEGWFGFVQLRYNARTYVGLGPFKERWKLLERLEEYAEIMTEIHRTQEKL